MLSDREGETVKLNRYLSLMLALMAFSTSPMFADSDVDVDMTDLGPQDMNASAKKSPFSLAGRVDAIKKTEISQGYFKGDTFHFSTGEAEAGMVFYYCPAYSEGANVAITYTSSLIDWQNNPWFCQDHFNTVTFTLGGMTKRIKGWFWQAQVGVNVDADEWDLVDYANYDLLLWGRYEYCPHIGVHIGFIAQTGMQMDRVYPILGADWRISRNWKLNLVYPVNVSLEYLITDNWSVYVGGRTFNVRYRVGKHESSPKNVIRYENLGAEAAVVYQNDFTSANIHVGSTLGGKFRVANEHNDHPHHYKLRPSGYVGGEVVVKF